jgi:hypothetical protein
MRSGNVDWFGGLAGDKIRACRDGNAVIAIVPAMPKVLFIFTCLCK